MKTRLAVLLTATTLIAASSQTATLGPRIRYLRHLVETGRLEPPPTEVAVSLVFQSAAEERVEPVLPPNVKPRRGRDGSVLRTHHVLPVLSPIAALDELARLPNVVLVETGWLPRAPPPPLDVSRPQIQTPMVWSQLDPEGLPITGAGVVIADLDSGVDVFHPHFFHPDGGRFEWLDVDRSGNLSPGVDAVDLDGDSSADANEILQVLETPLDSGHPATNPRGYDVEWDWLYADTNRNGSRDFGRAAGYTDADPTFGEPLFFADDLDRDDALDVGEELVALGSSKIRVVRERDGTLHRRGIDLIDTLPDDYAPHGTWVSGIMLGGIAGVSRIAGQAPDAELVLASLWYAEEPPFSDDLASLAVWARDEGARLHIYEIGSWMWTWLDGSHPEEMVVTDLAAEGYPQLTPTGNLAGGAQQRTKELTAEVADSLVASTFPGFGIEQIWPSLLWRGDPSDSTLELELDDSSRLTPCLCATTESAGPYLVYSDVSTSPRGTTMINIEISSDTLPELSGAWTFHVTSRRDSTLHAYSWDSRSGWSGYTRWRDADNLHCVTLPATADTSIAVAAYNPRGGDLNGFSGRGTRIDGVPLVDLAAPGSTVFSTAPQERYGHGAIESFGGTSSALPHAGGAAALLAQLNPNDPHEVIERQLRFAALADSSTGTVPNDSWGEGKLRLFAAYQQAAKPSLLRDDSLTSLAPVTPPLASIFSDTGRTTLRLAGPSGFSSEGEGDLLAEPGSSDGDAFLAFHPDPDFTDPEGSAVVTDLSRPLVFYQLAGNAVLKLVKTGSGPVASW